MANNVPNHVGIILDGNRRWAKQHGLPTSKGHEAGANTLIDVSLFALEQGVKYLSVFVFSTENWKRSKTEVNFILTLLSKVIKKNLAVFNERNIKVLILGSEHNIPSNTLRVLKGAVQDTKHNTGGVMAFCFNYGGRQEIVDAAVAAAATGQKMTQDLLSSYMYGGADIPDVDLIIRTSGEQRLSGFMMWRAAYAELVFVDKFWPDFTEGDFIACLTEYQTRQRRYGG